MTTDNRQPTRYRCPNCDINITFVGNQYYPTCPHCKGNLIREDAKNIPPMSVMVQHIIMKDEAEYLTIGNKDKLHSHSRLFPKIYEWQPISPLEMYPPFSKVAHIEGRVF